MSVVDVRAETRAYGRARLRELALDAARDVVLDNGWAAVRMGVIATAVGISRQSLHAEFGTKDDLGNALVMRETEEFFDGVFVRLNQHHGDLGGAVFDAAQYMVAVTRGNPLLQTILTQTPVNGGDASLLPLLTVRGEPLIGRAAEVFGDWVSRQWPEADPADVRLTVESVARLCLNHIVTPTKAPAEAAQDLALVACRCLRMADPQPPVSGAPAIRGT